LTKLFSLKFGLKKKGETLDDMKKRILKFIKRTKGSTTEHDISHALFGSVGPAANCVVLGLQELEDEGLVEKKGRNCFLTEKGRVKNL